MSVVSYLLPENELKYLQKIKYSQKFKVLKFGWSLAEVGKESGNLNNLKHTPD